MWNGDAATGYEGFEIKHELNMWDSEMHVERRNMKWCAPAGAFSSPIPVTSPSLD